MQLYEVESVEKTVKLMNELAKEQADSLIVVKHADVALIAGKTDGTYSENLRRRLNLPIAHAEYIGGSVIVFPGDLSFARFTYSSSDFGWRVLQCVRDYLVSKNIDCRLMGNDLMIFHAESKKWFKVASQGAGWLQPGYMQTLVHFSINTNVAMINHVCTKHQHKVPGSLSDYDITADELYSVLMSVIDAEEN